MFRLGSTNLDEFGVKIKEVKGLYDFPSIKNEGTNWADENYTEALNRVKDFQYNSKRITLDCFIYRSSWTDLNSALIATRAVLNSPSLRLLILSDYSNLGYVVRLIKETIFKPNRYFENSKCMASFSLVFEEPQPFAIKFYWDFSAIPIETDITLSFTIKKALKGLSFGSIEQQFIDVFFNNYWTTVNLEEEDFTFDYGHMPHRLMSCVVVGEIDSVEQIMISGSYPAQGIITAGYYLRNGEIITE